jgi:hypothetical protein
MTVPFRVIDVRQVPLLGVGRVHVLIDGLGDDADWVGGLEDGDDGLQDATARLDGIG